MLKQSIRNVGESVGQQGWFETVVGGAKQEKNTKHTQIGGKARESKFGNVGDIPGNLNSRET